MFCPCNQDSRVHSYTCWQNQILSSFWKNRQIFSLCFFPWRDVCVWIVQARRLKNVIATLRRRPRRRRRRRLSTTMEPSHSRYKIFNPLFSILQPSIHSFFFLSLSSKIKLTTLSTIEVELSKRDFLSFSSPHEDFFCFSVEHIHPKMKSLPFNPSR